MFGLPMHINGRRQVRLMPFTEQQARDIAPYWLEPVTRYLATNQGQTADTEASWYQRILKDDQAVHWGIFVQEGEDWLHVGNTGLHLKPGLRATTGTVIFRQDYWGQGIISAAHMARTFYVVDKLDLLAIDSEVFKPNEASWRALDRVGYCRTGISFNLGTVDGQPCDVYHYTWVNPIQASWEYFWRGRVPSTAHSNVWERCRRLANKCLSQAEKKVSYLS